MVRLAAARVIFTIVVVSLFLVAFREKGLCMCTVDILEPVLVAEKLREQIRIYAVCGIDPATSFTEETSGVPETSDALETTEALGTTDIAEVDTGPGKSNRMIALIVGVVVAIAALVVVVLLLLWLFVFRKKRGQHADENEVELADETFYGAVEDTEPSVFDNLI